MKVPNGDRAVVDIVKLRDYWLSAEHLRGRHKARVFTAALDLTADQADQLQAALLQAVQTEDAMAGDRDEYGQRYWIDFTMTGPAGEGRVRSTWIVRTGEDFP